jgi:LuxR family maltose regulon positive regulatory protein
VYLALAWIALQRHRLADVDWALRRGFDAYRTDPEPAQYVGLRVTQARLLLARGQPTAALALLDQTGQETEKVLADTVTLAWMVALARGEAELVAGRPDRSVDQTIPRLTDTDIVAREQVWRARVALATGDPRAAELLLAPVLETPTDPLTAVEAWITTALVAETRRQGNRSVEALGRAFAIAEPEQLRRPFLVTGRREMVALVERQALLVSDNEEFVASVLADLRPGAPLGDRPAPKVDLSEREFEVLRYLPTMFNAGEIAQELHVSVNTVKAHLRAIYRKLDVSRRQDAVGRAQEYGIL